MIAIQEQVPIRKIWGLEIREYYDPVSGYIEWRTRIDKPFYWKGKSAIGLSRKMIMVAERDVREDRENEKWQI